MHITKKLQIVIASNYKYYYLNVPKQPALQLNCKFTHFPGSTFCMFCSMPRAKSAWGTKKEVEIRATEDRLTELNIGYTQLMSTN